MKLVHRIHRLFGSVFALLLAVWFVSGGVMTFSGFPAYEEHERLGSAPALLSGMNPELPPSLRALLEERGFGPRLVMLEGRPTWVANEADGRHAYLTHAPWTIAPLDQARAVAQASKRTGKRVLDVERVDEPDQWSVGIARKNVLPLYRVFLEGTQQVYVSPRTGEILQQSDRVERALAWVGAIPHWIYPTILRRERLLWKNTVLVLSAIGLVVSLSGSIAGLRLWWLRRRKGIKRAIPDVRLRWHQYLGLAFGLLVTTWLFSGALSLTPFDWTGDESPSAQTIAALYGPVLSKWEVGPALASCQQQIEVRELELTRFAGRAYAVCYGSQETRVVDLETLEAREHLDVLPQLASRLQAHGALQREYDSYYFPRKRGQPVSLPYWRFTLEDERDSVLYVDPARARMASHLTRASRLERWLYQGLHCLDLPGLYEHRALWRTVMITAMAVGATLSLLGFAMTWRKLRRRR